MFVCQKAFNFTVRSFTILFLAEKVFRHPGVTMKSAFYLKLVTKAARVTKCEHTQVFLVNNLLVAPRRIQRGH